MHATRPTPDRRLPACAFPLAAGAVVAAVLPLARLVPEASRPGPVAYGILADLLVTIPALWYVLVVRGRRVPARTLFPILAASFALASVALPPAIRPGKLGLEVVIAIAELGAIAVLAVALARGVRRARGPGAVAETGPAAIPERIAGAARRAFGVDRVAEVLAFEVSTVVYALAGWRMKAPKHAGAFSAYRESGWSMGAIGLGLVLAVEAFPVHVLAARAHPALAWALTASTLYSFLWLVGDFQALRLRPIRVDEDALLVRLGLRWKVRLPWHAIRSVGEPRAAEEAARKRETLRAVLLGDPTVAIELSEPVVATGPYGIRRTVTRVTLAPDDRATFLAALAAHVPAALPAARPAAGADPAPHARA